MFCDALLDKPQRYSSPLFRRCRRLRDLDAADIAQLVAFVEAIGVKSASYVFARPGLAYARAYREVRALHQGSVPDISIHMGIGEGLAILRAMQDGGYRRGQLPRITKMALKGLRKRGMTIAEIARRTKLTREQVKRACDVRLGQKRARSAAYSALALG